MVYIEIHTKDDTDAIRKLNKHLKSKHGKTFIFHYMEGCGPCNLTRPEWSKLPNVLSKLKHDPNVYVVLINQEVSKQALVVDNVNMSFPAIKYITNGGSTIEDYEDANIEPKDRSIDSFVAWIKSKTYETKGGAKRTKRRKSKRLYKRTRAKRQRL